MRMQTLLDSAEPAIPNITAPSTMALYTNQATVTHTVEEGRRQMFVTQLCMTFDSRHLSAGAQQSDIKAGYLETKALYYKQELSGLQ